MFSLMISNLSVAFELNTDGQLNAADLARGSLQVCRDLDQDGITDAGELSSLDALAVGRIGVIGSTTNATGGLPAGVTEAQYHRHRLFGHPVTWSCAAAEGSALSNFSAAGNHLTDTMNEFECRIAI